MPNQKYHSIQSKKNTSHHSSPRLGSSVISVGRVRLASSAGALARRPRRRFDPLLPLPSACLLCARKHGPQPLANPELIALGGRLPERLARERNELRFTPHLDLDLDLDLAPHLARVGSGRGATSDSREEVRRLLRQLAPSPRRQTPRRAAPKFLMREAISMRSEGHQRAIRGQSVGNHAHQRTWDSSSTTSTSWPESSPPTSRCLMTEAIRGSSVAIRGSSVAIRGSSVAIRGSSVAIRGSSVAIRGSSVAIEVYSVAITVRSVAIRPVLCFPTAALDPPGHRDGA